MAVNLTDHIGSMDMVLRFEWNAATGNWRTSDGEGAGERQSFSAWGERRNGEDWSELRGSASAAQRTSAVDENRGFTGHEMLDDFGLIHMNGRIYDPELGRFLSADPFVQVPEFSQNFNRYSYVLNNPLSMTDPSGNSWLKDNWVTVVVAVVMAVVTYGVSTAFYSAASAAFTAAGGTTAVVGTSLTTFTVVTAGAAGASAIGLSAVGMAVTGAIAGFVGGGLNNTN
jgi:RHS repeat-associated protein